MRTLIILALALAGAVQAQTLPWDTNVLNWTASVGCETGTECPVTGYIIERSSTGTGTYSQIAAVADVTTYTHTGAASGTNCYRVRATAATGTSGPSNVVCKVNTEPAPPSGPPNPPTNLRVIQSVAGVDVSPVFTIGSTGRRTSTLAGLIDVGSRAGAPLGQTYRGMEWCEVSRADVDLMRGYSPGASVRFCAPCA